MFGVGDDLVLKSYEEMRLEVASLVEESEDLKVEAEKIMLSSDELRIKSIETRSIDPDMAEKLWLEADDQRSKGRDLIKLSVEKRIRAAEIKYRLDIHDQIEAVTDEAEKLWRGAIRSGKT